MMKKNDETGNLDRPAGKKGPIMYGDLLRSIETLGEYPRHVFSEIFTKTKGASLK